MSWPNLEEDVRPSAMNEQRLIEIETKLAHQEVLIAELNQVITQQQITITQLETSLKSFVKEFLAHNANEKHANEKPPHY